MSGDLVNFGVMYVVSAMTYKVSEDGDGHSVVKPIAGDVKICEDYEKAVDKVKRCMYRELCLEQQNVPYEQFLGDFHKHVSVIRPGDKIEYGEEYGFVHSPMDENGVEAYQGFDTTGNYPHYFSDYTIVRRSVAGVSASGLHFDKELTEEEAKAKAEEEAEKARLDQECIDRCSRMMEAEGDDPAGTAEKQAEYRRLMEMLGGDGGVE